MTIPVGSKGDFGKHASHVEHVLEKLEDPDLYKPADISWKDHKFQCTEKCKRHSDRLEGPKVGEKKLHSSLWGQCTQVIAGFK